MANAHYFYLPLGVPELEKITVAHQEDFDEYLNDLFSEEELQVFEKKLDSIAAVFVQPIISELSFDDFYANEAQAEGQRFFFGECKSCICLENLPDFHSNPFQVSYLIQLLNRFDEVLIDQGGVEELVFKEAYLAELKGHKSIETLISSPLEKPVEIKTTKPIYPIDFLILDVYKELDRLRESRKIYHAIEQVETLSEKAQKIFNVMKTEKLDSTVLLRRTGLIPKDFDDNLERLKFFLKKL